MNEAALKAVYISNMVFLKVRGQWREFLYCQVYHGEMFGRNDITVPGSPSRGAKRRASRLRMITADVQVP